LHVGLIASWIQYTDKFIYLLAQTTVYTKSKQNAGGSRSYKGDMSYLENI